MTQLNCIVHGLVGENKRVLVDELLENELLEEELLVDELLEEAKFRLVTRSHLVGRIFCKQSQVYSNGW